MNFLCIYLGEKGGGGSLMHVYVWKHIVSLYYRTATTELLNGCLRNFVGMKCSWPGTCIEMFWPYLHRGGSRARQNRLRGVPFKNFLLQTGRLQQQTEFIAMI